MPLVNCDINLILTWPEKWVISSETGATQICNNRYKNLCSYCHFIDPLKHLESGFKRIFNWNKYESKLTEQTENI